MSFVPLTVISRRLAKPHPFATLEDVLGFTAATDPLVWLREDAWAVGSGEAVRLTAQGADRFTSLQQQWQQLAAAATVHDAVQVPGSGLLAFGTVSYSPHSAATSLLVVPRVVVQRHGAEFFVTTAQPTTSGDAAAAGALAAQPITAAELLELVQPHALAPAQWRGCELQPQGTVAQQQDYAAAAQTLLQQIATGQVHKTVLSRQITGWLAADADLRVPLLRLAEDYRDCAIFALDGFVGASPETLARSIAGRVTTRVLAGTAPRHHDNASADAAAGEFLLQSPQIAAEHEFAAQSVIKALSPLVAELDTNTRPLVIALPNVWHRATDIAAAVSPDISSLELVAAMHPTAAVAGTPTPVAVRLLHEVEGFDRGRYAGAVGWISASGDGEWALALRCAQISPANTAGRREIVATAGGGLVAGSEIHTEFAETVAKFAPIVTAFAPCDEQTS